MDRYKLHGNWQHDKVTNSYFIRLEMFTKVRLSVEEKQALNFIGILKRTGVQLGHVQLLDF